MQIDSKVDYMGYYIIYIKGDDYFTPELILDNYKSIDLNLDRDKVNQYFSSHKNNSFSITSRIYEQGDGRWRLTRNRREEVEKWLGVNTDIFIRAGSNIPIIVQNIETTSNPSSDPINIDDFQKNGLIEASKLLKKLIADGEENRALDELEKLPYLIQRKKLYNQFIHVSGWYKDLERREKEGVIKGENYSIEKNQIRRSIIDIVDHLVNSLE